MFQQPGPGAETTSFRTWADVDVVVKLQVTDAQVADQEIGDFVQVLDRRQTPQANQYAYGGSDVGYIGDGAASTLTFTGVKAAQASTYRVMLSYADDDAAGSNTITFGNPAGYAPNIDKIIVAPASIP